MMMKDVSNHGWLALDVGAKTHAWVSKINGQRGRGSVPNDPAKLRTFLENLLKKTRQLRVLVEATGVYYLDVAIIAHELGVKVMVINPRAAHHFAKALNQRSKTDKLDAQMLLQRSEERRVGTESRRRGAPDESRKRGTRE